MDKKHSPLYTLTRPFGGIVNNLDDFVHKAKRCDARDVTIETRLGRYEPWFHKPAHDVLWVSIASQTLNRELTLFETTRVSDGDKVDYGRWLAQAHQMAHLQADGAYQTFLEQGIEASKEDRSYMVVPRQDRIWFYWV